MAGSPWGAIQHSTVLTRGMRSVSTCGHGGIMVTKKFAQKHLSESARQRGTEYGDYLCYEEDCDYAVAMFEVPETWDKLCGIDDAREVLMKSLSKWNADYLLEVGETPVEPQYSEYLESRKESEMRKMCHPDLIISARGDWHTGIPGVIQVETADGKKYHIKDTGYKDMRLKLLSKCEVVKEVA